MKRAVLEGLVCFGPNKGREKTYVRTDKWLGNSAYCAEGGKNAQDEASAELLRRYLRSYGPADRRDYSAWSGLRAREAIVRGRRSRMSLWL